MQIYYYEHQNSKSKTEEKDDEALWFQKTNVFMLPIHLRNNHYSVHSYYSSTLGLVDIIIKPKGELNKNG